MHLTKNVKACKPRSLHTILMTLDAKTCTEKINPRKLHWTLKHAHRSLKHKLYKGHKNIQRNTWETTIMDWGIVENRKITACYTLNPVEPE